MSHDRRIRLGEELKGDYDEIICVMDRSGSMGRIRDDAIGGFNVFLEDQKKIPGEAFLTLVHFAHDYEVVHEGKPIQEVSELTHETYIPNGSTALLDAIGKTIDSTKRLIDRLSENARPKQVIFVIITDGEENASLEYTDKAQIHKMVTGCTEDGWEFVFTAANMDAIKEGGGMGFAQSSISAYQATPEGTRAAYHNISHTVSDLRAPPPEEDDGEHSG
jgi:Mg-chelatase subunit ChlD